MVFVILLALAGLTLSGVAIYYSVIGLTAIFAAAFWPIVVMGTTLEISKLVAASWLKAKWNVIPGFMKTYMTIAVFVLMFITSMGIFGYLSKAHIEQTSMSTEQVAQIDTLNDKIARSEAKIERWTTDLGRLNRGEDVRVDNLIANEQEGLDKIYARIKSEKDSLRADAKIKVDQQQLRIEQAQDRRDSAIAAAEKKFSGSFAGSDEYEKAVQKAKSAELSVASRAQKEILAVNDQLDKDLKAVEGKYAAEVATIQKRIQGLRNQANDKTEDIEGKIVELEKSIEAEQKKIDNAREEKFVYEKEYRKLEAEVGPIKYIAEFIYGEEADKNLLEQAVTWVIITIIFVFDPLAVLMLLASQMTYAWYKQNKEDNITPSDDPIGPSRGDDDPTPPPNQEDYIEPAEQETVDPALIEEYINHENNKTETAQALHEGTETDSTPQDGESGEETLEDDPVVATVEQPVDDTIAEMKKEGEWPATKDPLEEWNEMIAAAEAEVQQEKTQKEIPNTRNKIFYTEEIEKPKETTYIVKEGDHQVTKTKEESYTQNEEQGEKGLWQKIQEKK
jgi:hypothetical protein